MNLTTNQSYKMGVDELLTSLKEIIIDYLFVFLSIITILANLISILVLVQKKMLSTQKFNM